MVLPVISTITPVLKLVINSLKEWDPALSIVYDPTLTYDNSITNLRNYNTNLRISPTRTFPLLAWNRSTFSHSEGFARRGTPVSGSVVKKVVGEYSAQTYVAVYGQLELNFIYIHQNFSSIEQFEILYTGRRASNEVTQVTLNLQDLGSFDYQVVWDLIEPNIQTSMADNGYYKFIGSNCKIRGAFFALDTPVSLIEQVNDTIALSKLEYLYQWEQIYPIDINLVTNEFSVMNSWIKGTPVKWGLLESGQSLPAPFVTDRDYYVYPGESGGIHLCNSKEDVNRNTFIQIQDRGSIESGNYFILRVSL